MIEITLIEDFPHHESIMWLTNFLAWITSELVFNSTMKDVHLDRFIFRQNKPEMSLLLFCNAPSQQRLMERFTLSIPLCYRDKLNIKETSSPITREKTPTFFEDKEDIYDYYLSE